MGTELIYYSIIVNIVVVFQTSINWSVKINEYSRPTKYLTLSTMENPRFAKLSGFVFRSVIDAEPKDNQEFFVED